MKKLKVPYIFTAVFLAVITFFFIAILAKFVNMSVLGNYPTTNSATDSENEGDADTGIDWESLYPFKDEIVFNYVNDKEQETIETDSDADKSTYVQTVESIENKIEYYSTNILVGRMKFVEANALFNKLIGMKLITGTDSVTVMNNGYLTYESNENDTSYAAKSLEWFNSVLKEKNINLLYVQCPSKENKFDNKLPYGMVDYNNQNADSLMKNLSQTDVKTIDLRPALNKESDDYYSCFFKTDHHWKPETGVWAAGKIAQTLNADFNYGFDENIGDISNYNIDVYKDYCFGSQGKKVSLTFAEPEDFDLVYPKMSTSFTADYSTKKITGDYSTALIDKSVLKKIDYYNISTYSSYLYGNNARITIHNNNCHNNKKILFIGDSFSHCVIPPLALDVEYIDTLDLRYFTGSVISYIEEFSPDTVIVSYNPALINSNSSRSSIFNFE